MVVGQNLTINNRKGIIVFTGNYNNIDYINVCFDDNNEYKTYRVTKDGDDFLLDLETDKNILSTLLAIWASEEIDKGE